MRSMAALLAVLLLAGCASTPRFAGEAVRADVYPAEVIAAEARYRDARVLWGGTIVDVRNEAERSVIEVLSYPLDDDQRPDRDRLAGARFLAVSPTFLDPEIWRAGREVTILGTVTGVTTVRINHSEQRVPQVDVADSELWRERSAPRVSPGSRYGFGIGIEF